MRAHYIIGIIAIVLLLALSGCKTGEVIEVDNVVEDEATEEAGGTANSEEEDVDVKELIKELSEEAGLEPEEDTTEESSDDSTETDSSEESDATEEESSTDAKTITIDNFEGTPEDMDIKVGETIKFTNEQENFQHVIGILPEVNGKYSSKPSNGWHPILPGESYEHKFEEAGRFQWVSKSNYPDTKGEIEVTE